MYSLRTMVPLRPGFSTVVTSGFQGKVLERATVKKTQGRAPLAGCGSTRCARAAFIFPGIQLRGLLIVLCVTRQALALSGGRLVPESFELPCQPQRGAGSDSVLHCRLLSARARTVAVPLVADEPRVIAAGIVAGRMELTGDSWAKVTAASVRLRTVTTRQAAHSHASCDATERFRRRSFAARVKLNRTEADLFLGSTARDPYSAHTPPP